MRLAMALLIGLVCGASPDVGGGQALYAQRAPVNYLEEVLRARDGAMVRWPARIERPLQVFVADAPMAASWSPAHAQAIEHAFTRWVATGIPIRVVFVTTPAGADVTVHTVARFAEGISGRTTSRRTTDGWLTAGRITLARVHADRAPLSPDELHAVALHEVGHLLGLAHVADPEHIMAPRIRARALSAMDEATIRALYGLPISRVPAERVGTEGPDGFDSVRPTR